MTVLFRDKLKLCPIVNLYLGITNINKCKVYYRVGAVVLSFRRHETIMHFAQCIHIAPVQLTLCLVNITLFFDISMQFFSRASFGATLIDVS